MGKYLINWGKKGKTEITDEMLTIINNAQHSIKIGNFFFEYKRIIDALKAAAERGVAVFVISNPQNNQYDNQRDNGYKSHRDNLMELSSIGAHVRYLDDLHAKFIICDDSIGIVTSANNNQTSLDRNSETGVTISGKDVNVLSRVYNQLFLNADITMISSYDKYWIKSKQQSKEFSIDESSLLASNIRVTLNSENSKNITNLQGVGIKCLYKEIISIIDRSEKECFVVTWHFNCADKEMPLEEFISSLKRAKDRGVNITVYSCIGDTQGSQSKKNQPSLKRLEKIVDAIYGDDNNHSKCVITESEGIVFSANIDPKGLKTGFEVGVILSEEERKDARQHIDNLIKANPNNIIE